jgi:signal transduction histidine kinase
METASEEIPPDEAVLVLAPIGKDTDLATSVLINAGFQAEGFRNISQLFERLKETVGVLVLAEEALPPENAAVLRDYLQNQEAWSDIPIILLGTARERVFPSRQIVEFFSPSGNISILERPFHTVTLISSVRVALRARRRQYQVRELLNQQLIAVKQRDEFMSVASHELKTPLTSLKLQFQMKKRFFKRGDNSIFEPKKVMAMIDSADHHVDRLARLVDDMLDVSRIANGKLALNCEEVLLEKIIDEVLSDFEPQLKEAECAIELDLDHSVRGVWDPYRVEQVVANLVSNAIKYGRGKPLKIEARIDGDQATLMVTDHGIGISEENKDRIFQRFERAVNGNIFAGLGLGLYITREILELHGGKITVQSEVGKGSTFIVQLPLRKEGGSYAEN